MPRFASNTQPYLKWKNLYVTRVTSGRPLANRARRSRFFFFYNKRHSSDAVRMAANSIFFPLLRCGHTTRPLQE